MKRQQTTKEKDEREMRERIEREIEMKKLLAEQRQQLPDDQREEVEKIIDKMHNDIELLCKNLSGNPFLNQELDDRCISIINNDIPEIERLIKNKKLVNEYVEKIAKMIVALDSPKLKSVWAPTLVLNLRHFNNTDNLQAQSAKTVSQLSGSSIPRQDSFFKPVYRKFNREDNDATALLNKLQNDYLATSHTTHLEDIENLILADDQLKRLIFKTGLTRENAEKYFSAINEKLEQTFMNQIKSSSKYKKEPTNNKTALQYFIEDVLNKNPRDHHYFRGLALILKANEVTGFEKVTDFDTPLQKLKKQYQHSKTMFHSKVHLRDIDELITVELKDPDKLDQMKLEIFDQAMINSKDYEKVAIKRTKDANYQPDNIQQIREEFIDKVLNKTAENKHTFLRGLALILKVDGLAEFAGVKDFNGPLYQLKKSYRGKHRKDLDTLIKNVESTTDFQMANQKIEKAFISAMEDSSAYKSAVKLFSKHNKSFSLDDFIKTVLNESKEHSYIRGLGLILKKNGVKGFENVETLDQVIDNKKNKTSFGMR